MTSRLLSRHAPSFALTLPPRQLQQVVVVSSPSPAPRRFVQSNANGNQKTPAVPLGGALNQTAEEAAEEHASSDADDDEEAAWPSSASTIDTVAGAGDRTPLSAQIRAAKAAAQVKHSCAMGPAQPSSAASAAAARGPRVVHQPITHRTTFAASEIVPHVYLGSWMDADQAAELVDHNIHRVLNVARECSVSTSCVEAVADGRLLVKKLDIRDHSDVDIAQFFQEAVAFMRGAVDSGRGVLVHCHQGVSRSATIVLAYLMSYGVAGVPLGAQNSGVLTAGHRQQQQPSVGTSPEVEQAEGLTVGRSSAGLMRGECRKFYLSSPSPGTSDEMPMTAAAAAACVADEAAANAAKGNGASEGSAGARIRDQLPQVMCYDAAFDFLKMRRPHVSPNLGFVLALHDLDQTARDSDDDDEGGVDDMRGESGSF
jgi:hypothetical protein